MSVCTRNKSTWFTEPNNDVGSGYFPFCLLNVTAFNGVLLYKFIKKMAGRATYGCLAFLFFWYLLDPHVIVQYIPETSETTEEECFTNQKQRFAFLCLFNKQVQGLTVVRRYWALILHHSAPWSDSGLHFSAPFHHKISAVSSDVWHLFGHQNPTPLKQEKFSYIIYAVTIYNKFLC